MLLSKLYLTRPQPVGLLSRLNSLANVRTFSRADIKAELDKTKIQRRVYYKNEMVENPEFFKAYPHMQVLFNVNEENTGVNERPLY